MQSRVVTFVVRLEASAGSWTGVIERVRTGEKQRVLEIEAIGELIARSLGRERHPFAENSLPNPGANQGGER
jgi:hypothetical protein